MKVTETTPLADAVLPVARLRAHLRLGSGFGTDGLQDGLLAGFLRAALSAIEARTGKALMSRAFLWEFEAWRDHGRVALPLAPVSGLSAVTLIDHDGQRQDVSERCRLIEDAQRPEIAARGATLPMVPAGGAVEVAFDAGYGPSFDDLPADLQQAVMLLAAHYYEFRDETALSAGCMPFGVSALIETYRPLRIGGAL